MFENYITPTGLDFLCPFFYKYIAPMELNFFVNRICIKYVTSTKQGFVVSISLSTYRNDGAEFSL